MKKKRNKISLSILVILSSILVFKYFEEHEFEQLNTFVHYGLDTTNTFKRELIMNYSSLGFSGSDSVFVTLDGILICCTDFKGLRIYSSVYLPYSLTHRLVNPEIVIKSGDIYYIITAKEKVLIDFNGTIFYIEIHNKGLDSFIIAKCI